MPSDIQKVMASKYPFSIKESLSPQLRSTQSKFETTDLSKTLIVVVLLSILFFILSSKFSFKFTENAFPSTLKSSSQLIHTIIFALLSFFIIRMC